MPVCQTLIEATSIAPTIVGGLRIIDSNAQTGTTWWNWTANINILRILFMFSITKMMLHLGT
jgi:hypothetical protein